MRKTLFSMLIFCALIFIQSCADKPKVAVYVTGDIKQEENKTLYNEMTHIFTNSGEYETVERSESIFNQIKRELEKQRSGDIDTNDIAALDKQLGVKYLCVTYVTKVFGSNHISARLIDLKTAVIVSMGNVTSRLEQGDFESVAKKVTEPIITGKKSKTTNIESKSKTGVEEEKNKESPSNYYDSDW